VVDRVAPSPVTTERSVPRRSEALAAPAAEPANPQAAEPVRQVQYYAPQPAVKADSPPEHSETVATMTVVPAPAPERAGVKEIVAESPPGKRKSPPTDGETNERRGAASQPSPKEFERLQAARNFSVALEKQSRIQHLVQATQAALTHEPVDPERIEKLLDEVAQVKGADHPFVLKLRGYWLIKQERWESASELLTRVTAREPDDLEAGINLSMIEMRRDDRDAALVRLSRLRQTYPDNAQVCDLLRRLQ
jgi:predicted Zn-dependent protease